MPASARQIGTGRAWTQCDGRRAAVGMGRPQQAQIIARAQIIQQRLQQGGFMRAHQVMHGGHARGGRGLGRAEMMGMQRINIIRHARAKPRSAHGRGQRGVKRFIRAYRR